MRQGRKSFSASNYYNTEVAINELQNMSQSASSSVTSVSDSDSNQTLLSANLDRKGLILFNNSTAIAYVKFGATATSSDFTIRLVPYGTYDSNMPVYTGRIDAIWASNASGSMLITELS